MASGNTRSNNVVTLGMTPSQPGDCISDKMSRELLRRMTGSVLETSTPGDAVVSRTPPEDTSKIWYPADENGFPIGTAYKYDPLTGQWTSTAVVPQAPPCKSADATNLIKLDSKGCWIVSRSDIEVIIQQVGLQISADQDNAIRTGSDGGLYVETVDISVVGQIEIYQNAKDITNNITSVPSTAFDLDSLPSVTVPSWATHAIVRASCGLITNNLTANSNSKAFVRVAINGDTVAAVGINPGPNTNTDSSGDDTNDVYAKLDGSSFNYQFSLGQSAGWGAQDSAVFELRLIGFVRASIPT